MLSHGVSPVDVDSTSGGKSNSTALEKAALQGEMQLHKPSFTSSEDEYNVSDSESEKEDGTDKECPPLCCMEFLHDL
ncbi:hypothetical protein A0H81_11957 [Grifola frondosa]|uniref:Uncharacterized protein n=1 Tax=Grifola frondosa TaxID=5627 RepID=A0A1C7LZB3_GRIFR|nr:hypothetical protein A0H81_11957 [Grifola frondosa]